MAPVIDSAFEGVWPELNLEDDASVEDARASTPDNSPGLSDGDANVGPPPPPPPPPPPQAVRTRLPIASRVAIATDDGANAADLCGPVARPRYMCVFMA